MPSALLTTFQCQHTAPPFPNHITSYPPPPTLPHPCRACHWSKTNTRAQAIHHSFATTLTPLDELIAERESQLASAEAKVRAEARLRAEAKVRAEADTHRSDDQSTAGGEGVLVTGFLSCGLGGEGFVGWERGSRERGWREEVEWARGERGRLGGIRRRELDAVWGAYERVWGGRGP